MPEIHQQERSLAERISIQTIPPYHRIQFRHPFFILFYFYFIFFRAVCALGTVWARLHIHCANNLCQACHSTTTALSLPHDHCDPLPVFHLIGGPRAALLLLPKPAVIRHWGYEVLPTQGCPLSLDEVIESTMMINSHAEPLCWKLIKFLCGGDRKLIGVA